MSLKNLVNNKFIMSVYKVYHGSIFTIGLVTIYMMNLLTSNNEQRKHHSKFLTDFSKETEEN